MIPTNLNNWQPFLNISNDDLIYLLNDEFCHKYNLETLNEMNFKQFENNFDDLDLNEINSDPDYNFFSQLDFTAVDCNYYFLNEFYQIKNKIKPNNLSFLHLNINSLPKNFDAFTNQFLPSSHFSFDILSFCETKLN